MWAQQTSDPQDKLQQTRDRMGKVSAELDLLHASSDQLVAKLADLDHSVASHQHLYDVRLAAAKRADAQVVALLTKVRAARAEVARQQSMLNQRIVSAYVQPDVSQLEMLIDSRDYNEFDTKRVFANRIADNDRTILDRLTRARKTLASEQAQATAQQQRARKLRDDAKRALDQVKQSRAEQAAVKSALNERIANVNAEAETLAADEHHLISIIQARHTSTGATPPPTTPPTTTPTTEPGPGSGPSTTTTTLPKVPGGPAFQWPVQGPITSPFGMRWGKMHEGIDIGVPTGTPIHAAAAGTVFYSGWLTGYGNVILIDHGNGWTTLYAHQSELIAQVDQTVSAGQTIGLSGSTGHSTGPHVHFEIRIWDVPHNPLDYLP